MKPARSMVPSMHLPVESGRRLANRHGWAPSDASARLVEQGLRRSEFAFLDFGDSPSGKRAYIRRSTLAVWEVMFVLRSYKGNVAAIAKHLRWPIEHSLLIAVFLGGGLDDAVRRRSGRLTVCILSLRGARGVEKLNSTGIPVLSPIPVAISAP